MKDAADELSVPVWALAVLQYDPFQWSFAEHCRRLLAVKAYRDCGGVR